MSLTFIEVGKSIKEKKYGIGKTTPKELSDLIDLRKELGPYVKLSL
jgi:hypothetical protein